jgi:hypothetical protein
LRDWSSHLAIMIFAYTEISFQKKSRELFRKKFRKHLKPQLYENSKLILFPFDSNHTDSRLEFATGEILGNEFQRCNEYFIKKTEEFSKDKLSKFTKIALLHHHPMPVVASEYKKDISIGRINVVKGSTDQEKFLVLNNSGTFLSEVLRHDFRLILHGHKHHKGISKAAYPIGDKEYRTIAIISAGSIGQPTAEQRYSFNVIDIEEDERILVYCFEKKGAASFTSHSKPIEIYSKSDIKDFNINSGLIGVDSFAKIMVINDYISSKNGDFIRKIYLKEWAPISDEENTIKSEIKSSSGLFVKIPEIEITQSNGYTANWTPIGQPIDGLQEGEITIEPTFLKEKPLNAEITIEIPNAISFTKEERASFTTDKFERIFRRFDHISAEKVIWNIFFPSDYVFSKPRLTVLNENFESVAYEKVETDRNLCFSKTQKSISTFIEKPGPAYTYQISWDLPSKAEEIRKRYHHSPETISDIDSIKEYLNSLTADDSTNGGADNSTNGSIADFLKCIYETITNMEVLNGKFKGEPLEIALSFYNDEVQALQYAAFWCPQCVNIQNSCIWNHKTSVGHPINGLVFKSKDVCFLNFDKAEREIFETYIRKTGCNEKGKHLRSCFGIPLIFPLKSKNIIAYRKRSF